MSAEPRTRRGRATRNRIIESATRAFAEFGFHEASIVRITEGAGVAMGTFYLYFDGKSELFNEVVVSLNRQLRQAMSEGSAGATDRIAAERGGFRGYFDFLAAHPEVYPIIREAWFVAPEAMRTHYHRILTGYAAALAEASGRGEIAPLDPEVAAWALMGVGEMVGMRYLSWEASDGVAPRLDDAVFEQVMAFVERALAPDKEES